MLLSQSDHPGVHQGNQRFGTAPALLRMRGGLKKMHREPGFKNNEFGNANLEKEPIQSSQCYG